MRRIETFDWWEELVALKDELSLRELAERFRVTPGAISAAMKREGLSRKAAPPGPRNRRKGGLPPEPGESAVAAKRAKPAPKAPPASGRKAHPLAAYAGRLGTVADSVIAQEAGVSVRSVAAYRARHRIPSLITPFGTPVGEAPARRSRIDPYADLLGTVPDRVVAQQAGVSLNAVRNYRVKKKIPAAGRGRPRTGTVPAPGATPAPTARVEVAAPPAPPAPAAAPTPKPASVGRTAWAVELADGETAIVSGVTLVEAATTASTAGEVVSMRRLGRML